MESPSHFVVNSSSCACPSESIIKSSETILRLRNTLNHFEPTKDVLQFFINCVEDLVQLNERSCLLLNISWSKETLLPSNFLGDIFYYATEIGHRAPKEKSIIFYEDVNLLEHLCTFDWIFIYSRDFDEISEKLYKFYDKTVFNLKEGEDKLDHTWFRKNSEKTFSITCGETYKHLWKGSKITIE